MIRGAGFNRLFSPEITFTGLAGVANILSPGGKEALTCASKQA